MSARAASWRGTCEQALTLPSADSTQSLGHGCVRHGATSTLRPQPEVTVRERVLTPPSQDLLHGLHSLHSPTVQLSGHWRVAHVRLHGGGGR